MKAPIKDGGPAFPTYPTLNPGMSLRDWFAGIATDDDIRTQAQCANRDNLANSPSRSELRYAHADDMIAVRAKGTTP